MFPALLVCSLNSVLYFLALRSVQHRGIIHIKASIFVFSALKYTDRVTAYAGGQ